MRGQLLVTLILAGAGCSLWDGSHFDTFSVSPEQVREFRPLDLRTMTTEALAAATRPSAEPAAAAPADLSLSIEDCRRAALENNLEIQSQLLDPEMAAENLNEADAAFEPYAFSSFNFLKTDTPTSLTLEASRSDVYAADLGFTLPLRTGGEIVVHAPFNRTETNNVFSTLNPSYTADFAATIDQPLLRGGGFRTATHGIRIARYGVQMAETRTRLNVIRVLAAVDRVYWRLYAARRELLVRKQDYDLAVKQLESARRKVQAQILEEIEVYRAEEAAAERLEAVIIAENAVRDRQRELKLVLNKDGVGMETPTVIVPQTLATPVAYELDRNRLIEFALQNRMELLEAELQIASDASTIDFERNGMLPLLSASYTYTINGLGATAADAYDLLLDNAFADHRVGLVLQVPLGNQAAASRVRRAEALQRQHIVTREQRERLIVQEVLAAADQLEANWQRVVASRNSVVLARRTLDAEQRRFDQGLQTSVEVLNAQARFADAQSAEISALVEYQIVQVDIAYAAGCLLGAMQIVWDAQTNELETK